MNLTRKLAQQIHKKLTDGLLPDEAPEKMLAGSGRGRPCDGCDGPILPAQIEYKWAGPDGRMIRLHVGCVGVWEAERKRRACAKRPA